MTARAPETDDRRRRLAEALRENLRRRKARVRAQGGAPRSGGEEAPQAPAGEGDGGGDD